MEMMFGTILAVTVFVAAPGACVASLSIGTKYISVHAKEWLAMSHGTRLLIGVDDDSTDTGYIFNMKPSVAKSEMLEVRTNGESNLVLNKFIPEDLKRIREHKKNGTLDQAHKNTGLYHERVQELFESSVFRDIPTSEWGMINKYYQTHLDRRLAQEHKKEIITEQVSQSFEKDQKRVLSVDVARKQLRQSPEQQWTEQYAKDAELTR